MKLMFWNIRKNSDVFQLIADAIRQFKIDVFVLAEVPMDHMWDLNSKLPDNYTIHPYATENTKTVFILNTKWSAKTVGEFDTTRATMLHISSSKIEPVNIVGCHLIDQMNNDPATQLYWSGEFRKFVEDKESSLKNDRTVIIGDFNMNPYDQGMTSVCAINSVMSKRIAQNESRTYHGEKRQFFFNPMWYFLGHPFHVNGTLYYNNPNYSVYWGLFDQILVRPVLMDCLSHRSVQIVSKIKDQNLLTNKYNIDKKFSDHLPIFANLKL